MPTIKQRKVAKNLVDAMALDNPPTGGEIVESSGYGKSMSLYPARVIDTPGVKEALNDLGFSEENAKRVVGRILLDESIDPSARLKASDQVFKVHGSYAAEKHVNLNVEVEASPRIKELAEKLRKLDG